MVKVKIDILFLLVIIVNGFYEVIFSLFVENEKEFFLLFVLFVEDFNVFS